MEQLKKVNLQHQKIYPEDSYALHGHCLKFILWQPVQTTNNKPQWAKRKDNQVHTTRRIKTLPQPNASQGSYWEKSEGAIGFRTEGRGLSGAWIQIAE